MDEFRLPAILQTGGNFESNWKVFKQQFDIYMKVTGNAKKPKEMRASILLNLMGSEGLRLFNHLKLNQNDQKDPDRIIKAFAEFSQTIDDKLSLARRMFSQRNQKVGEAFDTFLADLLILIRTCYYDRSEEESILLDRIIDGANKSLTTQFDDDDIELKEAIELCRTAEKKSVGTSLSFSTIKATSLRGVSTIARPIVTKKLTPQKIQQVLETTREEEEMDTDDGPSQNCPICNAVMKKKHGPKSQGRQIIYRCENDHKRDRAQLKRRRTMAITGRH